MKLIDDWQRVVMLSMSFWFSVIALAFMIIPEIWYALYGEDWNPYFLWWVGVGMHIAALLGRIFKQGNSKWVEHLRMAVIMVLITLLAVLASTPASAMAQQGLSKEAPKVYLTTEQKTLDVAVPFIAEWEGKRNKSYRDIVGVWTICYGSTRGIGPNMVMTDEQCTELLRREVAEYREKLHRYFTQETKERRLTPERDTAYTSLAFNAGISGVGKSTATKRLNNGDIAGGCQALTWWNKAGGRVIRGLVRRRTAEKDLCMKGL